MKKREKGEWRGRVEKKVEGQLNNIEE